MIRWMQFILISMGLFTSSLLVARNISFKTPELKGTGCPSGTHSVTISPDQTTISILFDSFSAHVPQFGDINDNEDTDLQATAGSNRLRGNPRFNYKMCNMVIKSEVPKGFKINSVDVSFDYRGFVYAENGVVAAFRSVLLQQNGIGITNGGQKDLIKKRWAGSSQPISEDFLLRQVVSIPVATRCVNQNLESFQLTVKNIVGASILNHVPIENHSGEITVDSADIVGQVNYKFNLQSCTPSIDPTNPTNPNPTNPTNPTNPNQPTPTCPMGKVWDPVQKKCVKRT